MAQPGPKILLALPAYNEAENLEPLIIEAEKVLKSLPGEYMILVVDDGSVDGSLAVLDRLAQRPGIVLKVITHSVNQGLGGAIKTGLRESLQLCSNPDDIIVGMDADNTHSPTYIPEMAAKIWNDGADVVIASRYRKGSREVGVPLFRLMLSRGARLVFQMFLRLPNVRDYTCGYRAYRVELIRKAWDKYGEDIITRQGFACTDELLTKLSTISRKITEIPFVLRYDKKKNKSKLPLIRTIWETLKMLGGGK